MPQYMVERHLPDFPQDQLPGAAGAAKQKADGIRRFRDSGGVGPEQLVVAHSDQGLHVTLVWGEGVDHELLGHFLLGRLTELGLPRPTVNHGTLATTSWNTLSAVTSG